MWVRDVPNGSIALELLQLSPRLRDRHEDSRADTTAPPRRRADRRTAARPPQPPTHVSTQPRSNQRRRKENTRQRTHARPSPTYAYTRTRRVSHRGSTVAALVREKSTRHACPPSPSERAEAAPHRAARHRRERAELAVEGEVIGNREQRSSRRRLGGYLHRRHHVSDGVCRNVEPRPGGVGDGVGGHVEARRVMSHRARRVDDGLDGHVEARRMGYDGVRCVIRRVSGRVRGVVHRVIRGREHRTRAAGLGWPGQRA